MLMIELLPQAHCAKRVHEQRSRMPSLVDARRTAIGTDTRVSGGTGASGGANCIDDIRRRSLGEFL